MRKGKSEQVTIFLESILKEVYSSLCHKANVTESSMGRILVIKYLAECGVLTPQLKEIILLDLSTRGLLTDELSTVINAA